MKEDLTAVIDQYEEPLIRYAMSMLQNLHDAQDVVQEAFIRFLKQVRDKDAEIANVKAWLYRVVHNLAVNFLKRKHLPDRFVADEMASKQADEVAPDRQLTLKDDSKVATVMLETLKEREQQIIILKVIEDKSYKEIASMMNLTVSNVGFILHTALAKLRKRMKGVEDDKLHDCLEVLV